MIVAWAPFIPIGDVGSMTTCGATNSGVDQARTRIMQYYKERSSAIYDHRQVDRMLQSLREGNTPRNIIKLFTNRDDTAILIGPDSWATIIRVLDAEEMYAAVLNALEDSDPNWRALASHICGETQLASALPHLVRLLGDDDQVDWIVGNPTVSVSAAYALAQMRGCGGIEILAAEAERNEVWRPSLAKIVMKNFGSDLGDDPTLWREWAIRSKCYATH